MDSLTPSNVRRGCPVMDPCPASQFLQCPGEGKTEEVAMENVNMLDVHPSNIAGIYGCSSHQNLLLSVLMG